MNLYPAIKAEMGRWNYYVVKMSMRELADNVNFAAEIYEDKTLDKAIQRVLNESRVQKELVEYLIRQRDHFFSSLVVAALKGDPKWHPVVIADDPRFELFATDRKLNDTFGVLHFDGTQEYYALDGQHRLAAIKALVNPNSEMHGRAGNEFKNEEMSVIVVVPQKSETTDDFLIRYRRLFSNLNRYAKPTDQLTNIIMDEDDVFAILTRRLITEHGFFKSVGRQTDSIRVKTQKGKNLKVTDPYFTSLETLYEMNILLLSTSERKNSGWSTNDKKINEFKKFRPRDESIDDFFQELIIYWDGIIKALPILSKSPLQMRHHRKSSGDERAQDIVLFWPIGQQLLAELARDLLDFKLKDPSQPDPASVYEVLCNLNKLNWNFHKPPWQNLLLIPSINAPNSDDWHIRSEDRKRVLTMCLRILKWQIGLDELLAEEVESLRDEWKGMLLPALDGARIDELWGIILDGCVR